MEMLVNLALGDAFFYFAVYLWIFGIAMIEINLPLDFPARKVMARVTLVGLWLMLGLRWETGTDWAAYLDLFKQLELDTSLILAVYHFDIGYVLLNALVRLFSDNYTVFLLVNSAIALALIYVFVRRVSPFPNASLLVFYTSYFVAHYMGSNRRILAIGLLLVMFTYAVKGNSVRRAVLQSFAFGFHRTSLVGIIDRFVPDEHFTKRQLAVIFGVCGALGASQSSVSIVQNVGILLSQFTDGGIVEKMIYYGTTSSEHVAENVDIATQTTLALIKRGLFVIVFFSTLRRDSTSGQHSRLLNFYLLSIAIYVAFIGSPIFQVLSTYFAAVEIGLVGMVVAYLPRSQRSMFVVFLFLYGVLQLVSALNPYPDLFLPYLSIFSDAKRWAL